MKKKRLPVWKKMVIGLLVFILLLGIGFQVFITRYLSPIVQRHLNEVIVKGSDSLYQFKVGKFNVGFWGGSVNFSDLHIYTDSVRYQKAYGEKKLPGLTIDLQIPRGSIEGLGLTDLFFRKKINIKQININEADVKLVRHFRGVETKYEAGEPLWKLIQPSIRSITIGQVVFRDLDLRYQNVDSATAFNWEFNKSTAIFTRIMVDSASAMDSSRILFARDAGFIAKDIEMNTPDGLYQLSADELAYTSSSRLVAVKRFGLLPRISNTSFNKHFGYQHEAYKLTSPTVQLKNFLLPRWISHNELNIDTVELTSPDIQIYLDRNARPNPYSKLGQYPQQLLQRAPFLVRVKRLNASGGKVTYREKNNQNQLTGTAVFPGLTGSIDHITNDPVMIRQNAECIARVRSNVLKKGSLNAVFRFNLADRAGSFTVNASISNLDAEQLGPLIKAMTSTEMQSFEMRSLDYSISGNQHTGTGQLKMKYSNMDVLLSKVREDGTLDKKGLLSFFVNRAVIHKENPDEDGEERVANNVVVQRDINRSFFNHIWKTLYSSAGKIVIRPAAQRRMEKRKARQ